MRGRRRSMPAKMMREDAMPACPAHQPLLSGAPNAALAQLVEHIIRNDGVTCSSHVSGTTHSQYPRYLGRGTTQHVTMARFCEVSGPEQKSVGHRDATPPAGNRKKAPRLTRPCGAAHDFEMGLEAEDLALVFPVQGNASMSDQSAGCQHRGLPTFEDGANDVRR
jgi:hypothetical protein